MQSFMQSLKSAFGLIRVLVPVLYCGGLLYYFFDIGDGSLEGVEAVGLGPTMIGLGAVGLLFCVPLILKIMRLVSGPRSPGSGPDKPADDEGSGFDADAAIARYMAQRSVEAAPSTPAARPSSGSTPRPGFGRRVR
jgi:hypothetical protein